MVAAARMRRAQNAILSSVLSRRKMGRPSATFGDDGGRGRTRPRGARSQIHPFFDKRRASARASCS